MLTTAAPGRWRRARTAAAPTTRRRRRGGRCAAAASETVFFLKSSGGNREGRVGGEPWARLRVTYVQRYILALLCRGAFAFSKRLLKLLPLASQCVIAARRWNRRVFRPGCAACPSSRSSAPPAAAAGPCCQTPAHSCVNRGKLNPICYIRNKQHLALGKLALERLHFQLETGSLSQSG